MRCPEWPPVVRWLGGQARVTLTLRREAINTPPSECVQTGITIQIPGFLGSCWSCPIHPSIASICTRWCWLAVRYREVEVFLLSPISSSCSSFFPSFLPRLPLPTQTPSPCFPPPFGFGFCFCSVSVLFLRTMASPSPSLSSSSTTSWVDTRTMHKKPLRGNIFPPFSHAHPRRSRIIIVRSELTRDGADKQKSHEFLSDDQLVHLKSYRYQSVDKSLISQYILKHYVCTRALSHTPPSPPSQPVLTYPRTSGISWSSSSRAPSHLML